MRVFDAIKHTIKYECGHLQKKWAILEPVAGFELFSIGLRNLMWILWLSQADICFITDTWVWRHIHEDVYPNVTVWLVPKQQ